MQITSGDMPMLSDLQLVYMVPRNSTELLKINTTKFQVEREPVYYDSRHRFDLCLGLLKHPSLCNLKQSFNNNNIFIRT